MGFPHLKLINLKKMQLVLYLQILQIELKFTYLTQLSTVVTTTALPISNQRCALGVAIEVLPRKPNLLETTR